MQYQLSIREHNKEAHVDIENDIQAKQNGLFTFTLRVNSGNIVDYNVTEAVDVRRKYLSPTSILVQEHTFTHFNRKGSQ